MKINKIFKKLLLIIGFLSFLIAPNKCWAGALLYLYDGQKWNLHNFSEESYISHENGLQKLIFNIEILQSKPLAQKGLIIIPLPCSLNEAKFNLINDKPLLFARNIKNTIFHKIIDFNIMSNILSGLFSAFYVPIMQFTLYSSTGGDGEYYHPPYDLYSKKVHYGISTDLVKYDKLNEFKSYLFKKSIYLDEKFDEIINTYINNKFTFAMVYLSEPEAKNDKKNFISFISEFQLFFKFKCNQIYYPLKIASIYTNPITNRLYIFGHKTPELYPEISKDTTINYYSGDCYNNNNNFKEFFPSSFIYYKWTKLEINTNAKNLIKDLSINDAIPTEAVFLSSFFKFIYLPISSIVYIILAYFVFYLLFLLLNNKNIPDKKFILFLSISFFVSHLFTYIFSFIIKLDNKICEAPKDLSIIKSQTSSKTQYKLSLVLFIVILSLFFYLYSFFYVDNFAFLFSIIISIWLFNIFFNSIIIDFYLLFYILFTSLNILYQYYFYYFIKSIL